ncbi:MAG: tetratricopeptide repeat protein [Candidatus Omnitrophica bacterium]|nr:tetratricopeptide repeat protein [Candidatus Omnitrophota bacterium]
MKKPLTIILACALFFASSPGYCAGQGIDGAWAYYLRGDYKQTISICRSIAGNASLGDQGRYIMGLAFLALGQAEAARENFEFVVKYYPRSGLDELLLLGIADSYFLEKDFDRAGKAYKAMLDKYPSSDYAALAYLGSGKALRKQGKWELARGCFNKIIQQYPSSLEAKEAGDYYRRQSFFTIQLGAFSKRENALRYAEALEAKGYAVSVDKEMEGNNVLYKIKRGNFSTLASAESELARLKKDGFSGTIIS